MTRPDAVVAVGASAGGIEAMRVFLGGLPADLSAAVLVVLHLPRSMSSASAVMLDRVCALPVLPARDGHVLQPGVVLVAQPDRHLLVLDGRVRLSYGPMENGHRPAIDPLMRSAAGAFGSAAIGVILSGTRDDGAAGLATLVRHGGAAVVQSPEDALHSSMPLAAIAATGTAHVAPAVELGPLVAELAGTVAAEARAGGGSPDGEPDDADGADLAGVDRAFGCPTCGGALVQVPNDAVMRFRCRVGHAWSVESLLAEQDSAVEGALWTALRSLEDKAALSRRMTLAADHRSGPDLARGHGHNADEAQRAADLIRDLIERMDLLTGDLVIKDTTAGLPGVPPKA